MSAHIKRQVIPTFEVRVRVKNGKGSKHYSSLIGKVVYDEEVKMFHRDARTRQQAMRMCEKYGHPVSARKADVTKMLGNMENLSLEQEPYNDGNPYESAIAMDEFIWKKKKREKRIQNREKDKKDLTK